MGKRQVEQSRRDTPEAAPDKPQKQPDKRRDPNKIAKYNARFRQSVEKESAGIWNKGEQTFIIRHFESLQSKEDRDALYGKLTELISGAKGQVQVFRQRFAEVRQDPWTCAVKEAAMIEQAAMHSWEDRQKVLDDFERNKQKGMEQSKIFRTICAAARQEGLLAEGDEKVVTGRYLEAFYQDRKGIIAQLKAFIEHHRQSTRKVYDRLNGLPRGQFSPEDIAWFKKDFASANAEGKRHRIKNFDTWVLAWQDKRERRGQQWVADMRAVPAEHLSPKEREARIVEFLGADAKRRKEMIVSFEKYRTMGEQNHRLFDTGCQVLVASGKLDTESARLLRAEFIDADWDRRVAMVHELSSGTFHSSEQATTSAENDHGTYFSKRFEKLMEEIVQERQGMIQYFREKEAASEHTDEIDVAAVTITTPQEVSDDQPQEDLRYRAEMEQIIADSPELPDNTEQQGESPVTPEEYYRPPVIAETRPTEIVENNVIEASDRFEQVPDEAPAHTQPDQKLEAAGAQLLVFDPLQKKLKNPGILSSLSRRVLTSIYHAMVDPKGPSTAYEVTKRLAEKRNRDEAPREELERLDKVA